MIVSNSTGVSPAANASKKLFSFDLDYALVALLFLIVLFGSKAMAFGVSAPSEVAVEDSAVFYVDITNDSSSTVDLKVNFFCPAESAVVAPKQLAPNSKTTAKITVRNTFRDERKITGLVEVYFGTQAIEKNVELDFTTKRSNSADSALAGLFSFGTTLGELGSFTLIDWTIFIVLVIVCAVLLISFVARIRRRA